MGIYSRREAFKKDGYEYVIAVDYPLQSIIDYIKLTDKLIDEKIKKPLNKAELDYDSYLKNEDELGIMDCCEAIESKANLKRVYYNSIFISLYTIFESSMKQFCEIAESNYEIKIEDLSGTGIFKYKKYLEKVVKINFNSINEEWNLIEKMNQIRNQITHDVRFHFNTNAKQKVGNFSSIPFITQKQEGELIYFSIDDKNLILEFKKAATVILHEIYYERYLPKD